MEKFEQKPIEIVHDGEPIVNSDEVTLAMLRSRMNMIVDNFIRLEKLLSETRLYMIKLEGRIKLSKDSEKEGDKE